MLVPNLTQFVIHWYINTSWDKWSHIILYHVFVLLETKCEVSYNWSVVLLNHFFNLIKKYVVSFRFKVARQPSWNIRVLSLHDYGICRKLAKCSTLHLCAYKHFIGQEGEKLWYNLCGQLLLLFLISKIAIWVQSGTNIMNLLFLNISLNDKINVWRYGASSMVLTFWTPVILKKRLQGG